MQIPVDGKISKVVRYPLGTCLVPNLFGTYLEPVPETLEDKKFDMQRKGKSTVK